MSVVQLGLSAIVGLVGVVIGQSLKLDLAVSLLIGIAAAGAGFIAAQALVQTGGVAGSVTSKKPAKKEKSSAEKKPKKEPKAKKQPQPQPEEDDEELQKPASEKPKKKKKVAKDEPAPAPTPAPAPAAGKKGKPAPAPVPVPVPVPVKVESEEEEDEEVQEAPKSKSALKKAKAKAAAAKKEAEERAAAEAAAKAAKKEAEERAAAEAAAAAANAGKKKKKKTNTEEVPPPKPTKPTKEEKQNLEEGDWEIPSHTKRSKKQEEAKAAKLAEKKAKESEQSVITDEKSNKSTAEIKVDVKQLGALIGTGGATLKLIQESTSTKIEVPKKDSGSSLVKITGDTIEDVSRARATIESLLTRGFSSITHPGEIQDDIHIPQDKIGAVVGTGGSILKKLQTATGTTIKMPDKTSTTSRATITGPKEQVKQAKQAIKALLADGFSPLTHPDYEKVELAFPKDKIGVLIGTKGQTIKSIQGNTDTRINIPDKNSPDQNVSVVGPADGVRQAVKEITRLLEPVGGYAPEDEDWVQDEVEAEGTWGFKSTAVQGEEALWD